MVRRSPNGVLSDLLSEFLDIVSDSYNSSLECDSTEDLARAVQDSNLKMYKNDKIEPDKLTIGSMDAVALYPSLRVEQCKEITLE